MKRWLVKIRRYDGSESVVEMYDHRDDAENEMRYLNEAYQTDIYYVEEFDQAKQHWPTGEESKRGELSR